MTEWRPINTAPKDGTPVLIFEGGSGDTDIVVAVYEDQWLPEYRWRGTYGDGDAAWNPTHWMPLPKAPAVME